jgi:hypothetical protein
MGKIIEFMNSAKGMRKIQITAAIAFAGQMMIFLIMWGSLTTTVKAHDKNINDILGKFNNIRLIGYVSDTKS